MEKCISFGKFNKYFYYILLTFLFDILNDTLYGFNYVDIYQYDAKIINTKTQQYLSWHHIIHQIIHFIGTSIFAYLFDKYESHTSQRVSIKTPNNVNEDKLKIELIHNDMNEIDLNDTLFLIYLFIIIIIWIVEELFIDIYIYALKDLDFWMVEIIIITYLNAYMFKKQIYKHQKLAIWFNIFPCLLKVITIILSLFDSNKEYPILYNEKRIYIPIGIIVYLILITLRSYVNSKIKWYMDLKYISASKLLMFYGLIGAIIYILIGIISSLVECYDTKDFELSDYICKVPFNDKENSLNITSKKYFENFFYYYKIISGKYNTDYSSLEILYEMIVVLSGTIAFFFQKYFAILVIKFLTPVHLIVSIPIFNFFQKLVLLIYNWSRKKLHIKSKIKYIVAKFILDFSGDFLSFLGFLIYFEIIELNCRKCSYNIKKNIEERSYMESYGIHENKIKSFNNTKNENERNESDEEESEESDELTVN
jgi:hypothetical protein